MSSRFLGVAPSPFFATLKRDMEGANGSSANGAAHGSHHDEHDPFAGFTILGPASHDRVREWALVLASADLWTVTRRFPEGWVLLVRDEDAARARQAIRSYQEENADWPPPRARRDAPAHESSLVVPIAFALMVMFFWVTGPVASGSRWFQQGVAVSDLVVSSRPWQAVTALTLHADAVHVLGNALSGSVFGSAVARRLGPGGGALALLASGTLGNVANAMYHHATGSGDHGSLGASTAVFGAIGVLAATQLLVDRAAVTKTKRAWTEIAGPIVGGLALLGSLGASEHADLGAHAFGFLGGLVVGSIAWLAMGKDRARGWVAQTLFGAVATGVVIAAWELALKHA